MAKGKHSTALFEVINRPARTGVAPPTVITRAPLNVPSQHGQQQQAAGAAGAGASLTAGGKAVQLDPDRHQISLRVSYTSALVTLFAVVVVVALAYLVGRGVSSEPAAPADATSTEDLKNGPASPQVLNVSVGGSPSTGGGTTPAPSARQTSAAPQTTTPVAPMRTAGPVAAPTNAQRIVGQNYVIMQSYPDEAQAKEAQAGLLAAGIPCTVERGPSGWVPMSWYSVIGTQGFDRVTKNPQLDAYVRAIENVKFAEKSKFKKLDPRAYRWK